MHTMKLIFSLEKNTPHSTKTLSLKQVETPRSTRQPIDSVFPKYFVGKTVFLKQVLLDEHVQPMEAVCGNVFGNGLHIACVVSVHGEL